MNPAKLNSPSNALIRHWPLILILLLSFTTKIAFHLIFYHDLDYWQSGYSTFYDMAQNFLRSGQLYIHGHDLNPYTVKSSALRVPIYPLFVAALVKMTGASFLLFVIAQAFISTLTVFIVYKITRHVAGKQAALFAAALSAFYPYSFVHDLQLQENGLYNCLATASVWLLLMAIEKKKFSLFYVTGILFGITTLTRATHLLHSILLILLLLFIFRKNWKQAFSFAGAVTLAVFLCLSPWLIRNKKIVDSFTLTSEQGFYLAIAHNELFFRYFPYQGGTRKVVSAFPWSLTPKEKNELQALADNEMGRSRWFRSRAIRYMQAHKLETLWQGLYKAAVNFLGILSPLQDPLKNTVYFLSYWILTLLALSSLPVVWKTFLSQIFVALSLSQAICSFVYFAHTSHRSFLDPMLAVFAGIGLARMLRTSTPAS